MASPGPAGTFRIFITLGKAFRVFDQVFEKFDLFYFQFVPTHSVVMGHFTTEYPCGSSAFSRTNGTNSLDFLPTLTTGHAQRGAVGMAAMGVVRAVDTYGSIPTLEPENAALRAALAVAQEDTRMISGKWRDAELRGEFLMMVGVRGRWLALGFAARMALLQSQSSSFWANC